jgi:DNA polymerase elongation subunit (family B)
MKKYTQDNSMYHILNARQNAIKLIMNSIYGLMESTRKGKYSLVPLAESTTCSGREFLTYVVFIFENDFDYFAKYLLIRDTFDSILKVHKNNALHSFLFVSNSV